MAGGITSESLHAPDVLAMAYSQIRIPHLPGHKQGGHHYGLILHSFRKWMMDTYISVDSYGSVQIRADYSTQYRTVHLYLTSLTHTT